MQEALKLAVKREKHTIKRCRIYTEHLNPSRKTT